MGVNGSWDTLRLILIRRMKPLGFTLEEMAELLRVIDAAASSPDEQTAVALDGFIEEAAERRAKLQHQLAMADEFIALLEAQQ